LSEELVCASCAGSYPVTDPRTECGCGGLLGVERKAPHPASKALYDDRRAHGRSAADQSGVWRFREAVLDLPEALIVTHPEGATRLYERAALTRLADVGRLQFKHEGENPTGSFKDRGMTVATTQAVRLGARAVACASTGNTSASLAAYAAQAGLRALVFVPTGKVALGKLAQTLAYGALCLQVRGDFDAAMRLVREASGSLGVYLLNSINPFRIEGQKTIVWELLQDLGWEPPDWIVAPAGNLGNTSAFGKALREARDAGWITRLPRLAVVQAAGANPFARAFREGFRERHRMTPETVATAIRIGDPVSWDRARAAIELTNGMVLEVTDADLLEAKAAIDGAGIGCEPASAVTLAGVRQLRAAGTMRADEHVVCVLTGHVLKDPDVVLAQKDRLAGRMVEIDPTLQAVEKILEATDRA
jgi:threonine synthase